MFKKKNSFLNEKKKMATQMKYHLQTFKIFPEILCLFTSSPTIVLRFEEEAISFATVMSDSSIGLYAKVNYPLVQKVTKRTNNNNNNDNNDKNQLRHAFFTAQIRKGFQISGRASASATTFQLQIVEDGLIIISKNNGIILNNTKIKAIDEEIPNLDKLENDFYTKEWYKIKLTTKNLFLGLSGIEKTIDDIKMIITPCHKNPTQGSLSFIYKQDFVEYEHFVVLPSSTASKLQTKKFTSTWPGIGLVILKDIIKHFPKLATFSSKNDKISTDIPKKPITEKKNYKRKRSSQENKHEHQNEMEEEEEDFKNDPLIKLKLLEPGAPISVVYDIDNITIKFYLGPKQDDYNDEEDDEEEETEGKEEGVDI